LASLFLLCSFWLPQVISGKFAFKKKKIFLSLFDILAKLHPDFPVFIAIVSDRLLQVKIMNNMRMVTDKLGGIQEAWRLNQCVCETASAINRVILGSRDSRNRAENYAPNRWVQFLARLRPGE
jgi:hypothetical protein